jgi:hypothetical protein
MARASTTPALPIHLGARKGWRERLRRPCPAAAVGRWKPVFLAIHPMASASLCCPIRRVVVLVPSGSSTPGSSARLSLHFGSRGRAVQNPRLMPLRTAQAVARRRQARHIGLVAVL